MSALIFLILVAESLQHALIVADNVADSEDSEDEWDYYRVDPNKQESAAAVVATDESRKGVEKQSAQNPESVAKGSTEIESPEIENDYIKCEELVKDTSLPELININVSICLVAFFVIIEYLKTFVIWCKSTYFEYVQ